MNSLPLYVERAIYLPARRVVTEKRHVEIAVSTPWPVFSGSSVARKTVDLFSGSSLPGKR